MSEDGLVLTRPIRTGGFRLAPVGDHEANAALMRMTFVLLRARSQMHLQVSAPLSGNTLHPSFHGAVKSMETPSKSSSDGERTFRSFSSRQLHLLRHLWLLLESCQVHQENFNSSIISDNQNCLVRSRANALSSSAFAGSHSQVFIIFLFLLLLSVQPVF